MGLNLSNAQTAQELGLNPDEVQRRTEQLHQGIVARQPELTLSGEGECDEYDIYRRWTEWGFDHPTVCPSRGEYACDDDGDGFYELAAQFWPLTLCRQRLRPTPHCPPASK